MKYYFLTLAIFVISGVFGQTKPLSNVEKTSLKTFLRVLIEDSEAGYVLFDKKPVCIHAYYFKDPFCVSSENHREAVALREGALIWRKLKKENSDVIIHISQMEDPQIKGYAHVLVINVPLFHHVINENLSLFQYVLGPSASSDNLFNALIHEDQPFHALLKYDKVLIGILLGFGTQNSLYCSRVENIFEASDKEFPPFLSHNLIQREFDHEYLPCPPSFGFKTTKEEVDDYSEKLVISSQSLEEKKPNFIFGRLKDGIDKTNNKKLISDLEDAQAKTQKLIRSENFDTTIIERITGRNDYLNSNKSIKLKKDKNEINKIIAKGLWELLKYDDYEHLPYFIKGIENPDAKDLNVERLAYFSNYLSDFIEAKENLETANVYFQLLDNNKEFQCIEPQKLFYKTIKIDENNKSVCKGPLVTLTYSIYSPLGHCLGHRFDEVINLKNTIPGFAHGVNGMLVGETREIFIHPSLAYGYDAYSLDKCIYLKAIVTLKGVHNEELLPKIKYLNIDFLLDPEVLKSQEINYRNALMVKGAIIASHLKKCKDIDLLQIKDYLNKFYSNNEPHWPTTQAEQDLINHVHRTIYWPFPEGDVHRN